MRHSRPLSTAVGLAEGHTVGQFATTNPLHRPASFAMASSHGQPLQAPFDMQMLTPMPMHMSMHLHTRQSLVAGHRQLSGEQQPDARHPINRTQDSPQLTNHLDGARMRASRSQGRPTEPYVPRGELGDHAIRDQDASEEHQDDFYDELEATAGGQHEPSDLRDPDTSFASGKLATVAPEICQSQHKTSNHDHVHNGYHHNNQQHNPATIAYNQSLSNSLTSSS